MRKLQLTSRRVLATLMAVVLLAVLIPTVLTDKAMAADYVERDGEYYFWTEGGLRQLIADCPWGGIVHLVRDREGWRYDGTELIFTEDLTIPEEFHVKMGSADVSVAEGKTLTVAGTLELDAGNSVRGPGSLVYDNGTYIKTRDAGTLEEMNTALADAASAAESDGASGSVSITAAVAPDIFYKILGEQTGLDIVDEASLLPCVVSLARAKRAYDKIKSALDQVEATGYGIVMPGIDELTLEEPEIVRQGGQYGVRLSASAPSLHIMRANIHTELSPTVGSEQQGEELIKSLLADFETDPGKLWSTNIFGKSLNELVSEGVQAKLLHMPQEARSRLQQTLERIINEGCDGLICILL